MQSSRRLSPEEATKHLNNLQNIDESIVSLLSYASTSLSALNSSGVEPIEDAKQKFTTDVDQFFSSLESVTIALRQEAKALQDADILTSLVSAKAEWVGRQKEIEGVTLAEGILDRLNGKVKDGTQDVELEDDAIMSDQLEALDQSRDTDTIAKERVTEEDQEGIEHEAAKIGLEENEESKDQEMISED
ncbi:uncharacterized protein V1516DRAFT_650822 [Lipomyces oligophaga]|uniref:uncharacterized protein n=1 Tax=Lipomyces oligophaga TaxID=45792 RepID=UPI0034CF20CF